MPKAKDLEAGSLLDYIRIQAVIRQEAKTAIQGEDPLKDKIATPLLAIIHILQKTDPLYLKLKKELNTGISRDGYILD